MEKKKKKVILFYVHTFRYLAIKPITPIHARPNHVLFDRLIPDKYVQ